LQGHVQNGHVADCRSLVEGCGFVLDRIESSHHIFVHSMVAEPVNLQSVKGETKPYQIKQFLRLVERYDLRLEDEGD
jgi:predicted RNA binding protein YcfA (HicA-like mRNA interferase family)